MNILHVTGELTAIPVTVATVAPHSPLSNDLPAKSTSIDVPKITTSMADTEQQPNSLEQSGANDSKDKAIDEPNDMANRKNRNNPNIKGVKVTRTKHGTCSLDLPINHSSNDYTTQDGSGSVGEHFTDQNGVDLLQFFKITLNKNTKDRSMLLRIEKELASLTQDESYV